MPAPDVTDPAPDDAPGLLAPHHVLQADVLPPAEAVDVVLEAAALGLDPSQVPGLVGGQHQVRSVQEQLVVTVSLPREPAPANLSFPSVSMTRNKSSHLFGLWFPSEIYQTVEIHLFVVLFVHKLTLATDHPEPPQPPPGVRLVVVDVLEAGELLPVDPELHKSGTYTHNLSLARHTLNNRA